MDRKGISCNISERFGYMNFMPTLFFCFEHYKASDSWSFYFCLFVFLSSTQRQGGVEVAGSGLILFMSLPAFFWGEDSSLEQPWAVTGPGLFPTPLWTLGLAASEWVMWAWAFCFAWFPINSTHLGTSILNQSFGLPRCLCSGENRKGSTCCGSYTNLNCWQAWPFLSHLEAETLKTVPDWGRRTCFAEQS